MEGEIVSSNGKVAGKAEYAIFQIKDLNKVVLSLIIKRYKGVDTSSKNLYKS